MQNRDLWEAYQALQELGQVALPPQTAFRIALNRNHLRPVFESLDAARVSLATKLAARPEDLTLLDQSQQASRLNAFATEWEAFLREPAPEWKSPAVTEARKLLGAQGLKPEALAPLLVVGILSNPDDATT